MSATPTSTIPLQKKSIKKKKPKTRSISSKSYKNESKLSGDKNQSASFKHIIVIKKSLTRHPRHACDKGGVKSIYSPFSPRLMKVSKSKEKPAIKIKMPISSYRATGMTSKEKSYVMCSCQSRSTRYAEVKKHAAKAIKEHRIFSIYGSCPIVRQALVERGWIEKIPANKMNLKQIRNGNFINKTEIHVELERLLLSNMVEKCLPNFIWKTKDEHRDLHIDMNKDCNTIVNKLKIDALWTTKQGLCTSMKRNYWFYIEDVAEVNGPRTYNIYESGELEGFVKDFRITACTSLLKWVLSMAANDRPVFVDGGALSLKVLVFALNRCKEYLCRKQNNDIDRTVHSVTNMQWSGFLKKYYKLISREDVFEKDTENKLPLYLSYAKVLLKDFHKYRPQLSCEGCHNIWIIKPAQCSRGRGIKMASKLAIIMNLLNKSNSKYVIQKYIEEPILIHETKFDIRQYYLVTSTYPLIIWMYQDCYLKFSSQKYNLKNFHESIHLTNNAVQRKYNNCQGRHIELPRSNMWDSECYKDYLNKIGKENVWDNIIYPGMKKSIVSIMLSCQDSLSTCKNRFELYGCDFILDKEYKPWLIEINSCPDLNHTTPVTAKICPAVISDIIKVVIDYPRNPRCSTGRFELLYSQAVSVPRYGAAADLFIKGYSLPLEYFYRGNISLNQYFDETDLRNALDVGTISAKRHYETDIMIEPEDDGHAIATSKFESHVHKTESEDELSEAATAINEQLEELMDKITSAADEHCTRFSNSLTRFTQNKTSDIFEIDYERDLTKSPTGIQSVIKNNTNSSKSVKNAKPFNFSRLEGKGSHNSLNIQQLADVLHKNYPDEQKLENHTTLASHSVLESTAKIISFIKDKQKEYTYSCLSSKQPQ